MFASESITSDKGNEPLPHEFNDVDSLSTRGVDEYYGYAPGYLGGSNWIADFVNQLSTGLSSYQNPFFQPVQDASYENPYPYNYSPSYDQMQWNYPVDQYDRNYFQNQPGSEYVDTRNSNYNDENYQMPVPPNYEGHNVQPVITKKISTIVSDDSKEIKHKFIVSPEFPDGAGYISISETGGTRYNGSSPKSGTIYHRI